MTDTTEINRVVLRRHAHLCTRMEDLEPIELCLCLAAASTQLALKGDRADVADDLHDLAECIAILGCLGE
jgi:hypothetical protein